MDSRRQAIGILGVILALVVFTYFFFRAEYNHAKRLRVVEEGRYYRSGQLTATGFADAVKKYGIRTIINVQDDVPDPYIVRSYLDRRRIHETEVCKQLGVRYVWLAPDLQPATTPGGPKPKVIAEFVELMSREDVYPVLLHCKAGLHRTGVLTAVYRMEFNGWSNHRAFRELKAHGFGEWVCTSANPYVDQYVLRHQPGRAGKAVRPLAAATTE